MYFQPKTLFPTGCVPTSHIMSPDTYKSLFVRHIAGALLTSWHLLKIIAVVVVEFYYVLRVVVVFLSLFCAALLPMTPENTFKSDTGSEAKI